MKIIKQVISFPYQVVHSLRLNAQKLLEKMSIYKRKKLPVPVISIGNFSFGGTGKTPVTIALAKYLTEKQLQVAVLTRGYKSKNKSPNIFSTIENNSLTVDDIGDEAMEMFEYFSSKNINIILVVGAKRYANAIEALKKYKIDVFILDDGLQHISLARDFEIVLINAYEKGYYRQFPILNDQIDFVLYTKVDEDWKKNNSDKNFVTFNLKLNKNLDDDRDIGIFTGTGDPEGLLKMFYKILLSQAPSRKSRQIYLYKYPDHHAFSLDEVTEVISKGIHIITTRKDITRIPKELRSSFSLVDVELEFGPVNLFEQIYLNLFKTKGGRNDTRKKRT